MNNEFDIAIVERFLNAFERIVNEGLVASRNAFFRRYGIDKRNFYHVKNDTSSARFCTYWLSILVDDYGVSAKYLLTGAGDVFDKRRNISVTMPKKSRYSVALI